MIDRLRRRVRRVRRTGESGVLLIIAIIIITVVAVVTGVVLTHGDGSLRATVALRDVARASYAADGAAQVAINDLRTGYNVGSGEPDPWYYTNVLGTGCFGYDGTAGATTPKDTLILDNLIPKQSGRDAERDVGGRRSARPRTQQGTRGRRSRSTTATSPATRSSPSGLPARSTDSHSRPTAPARHSEYAAGSGRTATSSGTTMATSSRPRASAPPRDAHRHRRWWPRSSTAAQQCAGPQLPE